MVSNALGTTDDCRSKIFVVIGNYEFNDNANRLKRLFASSFPTLLIDSSSGEPPEGVDVVIQNEGYRGLWNAAVRLTLERGAGWLFFIASDVQLRHGELLFSSMVEAANDPEIALWTPSVSRDSRHSFKSCTHRPASIRRICGAAEGFCFMVRTEVIRDQYPVPKTNRFGYSIDMVSAVRARELGAAVVDDRVVIYHPGRRADHAIDEDLADELGREYMASCGLDHAAYREIDLREYHAKKGWPTPDYGERSSLHLGCGAVVMDPFRTGNAWGVKLFKSLASSDESDRIRIADLVVEPIPYGDHAFDYIFAFDLIEHIPRLLYLPQRRLPLVDLMNEVHRVLKPGGLFLSIGGWMAGVASTENPLLGQGVTERTFLDCFCKPVLSAAAYGFCGHFRLEQQCVQESGRLLNLLRAI